MHLNAPGGDDAADQNQAVGHQQKRWRSDQADKN
jgi:hypothetical protein